MTAVLRLPPVKVRRQEVLISPQEGPQTRFLSSPAQIAIYGGAAGGGKSWALLLDALREAALEPVPGYGAVIFRRTSKQVTAQGGLWDESSAVYPLAGGVSNQTRLEWSWPQHRTRVRFSHMQYDKDRYAWQGAQVPFIGFDELTHFEESQFWYMVSRNRAMTGGRRRIRGTTNPDPDSWVKRLLAPWVDEDYPRPVRSGVILRIFREDNTLHYFHPGDRIPAHIGRDDLKTLTFIAASIHDNRKLLEADPAYLANLKALPLVERERLLNGNWKIRPAGNVFKPQWFRYCARDEVPEGLEMVRRWDLAATTEDEHADPDYTAGVLMAFDSDAGRYYVVDAIAVRETPGGVEELIRSTAERDGPGVSVSLEQEPGSSGKSVAQRYVRLLRGYDVHAEPSTGNKLERAKPLSAQAEGGNVTLVRGPWNDLYLNQLIAFPRAGVHDDFVDASSGAEGWLREHPRPRIRWLD